MMQKIENTAGNTAIGGFGYGYPPNYSYPCMCNRCPHCGGIKPFTPSPLSPFQGNNPLQEGLQKQLTNQSIVNAYNANAN